VTPLTALSGDDAPIAAGDELHGDDYWLLVTAQLVTAQLVAAKLVTA
jgi:hypothetical protein